MKVFPEYKFYPLAQLSDNVPILTCGAISKRLVICLLQYFVFSKVLSEKELCVKIETRSEINIDRILLCAKIELHID